MSEPNSAIANLPRSLFARSGIAWGFVGVLAFSLTVPLTRVAVDDGAMSPVFAGAARTVVAAVLAAVTLLATRARLPKGSQWWRIAVVAAGIVVAFPLLTSFALRSAPASHGAVVIALLPAATAVAAVIRTGERPGCSFWVAAGAGAIATLAFATVQGGGIGGAHSAGLLLTAAVVAAAVGYAEGGLLARELGTWQVICWALVVASPVMVPTTILSLVQDPPAASPTEWAAFAYLAVMSTFLGYIAWYRGLSIGPMAQVSQIQLTQPVMSIAWAVLLLGEQLTWPTVVGALAVVVCALTAVRSRARPATARTHSTTASRPQLTR